MSVDHVNGVSSVVNLTIWPSLLSNEGGHMVTTWADFLTSFVAKPAIASEKTSLEGWSPGQVSG